MSRYQVDKAIRQITNDRGTRDAFLEDSARFLNSFQLTDEERKALIDIDYPTLYALGVHPFMLHRFVMIALPADRRPQETEYSNNIARFGRPDFST